MVCGLLPTYTLEQLLKRMYLWSPLTQAALLVLDTAATRTRLVTTRLGTLGFGAGIYS